VLTTREETKMNRIFVALLLSTV